MKKLLRSFVVIGMTLSATLSHAATYTWTQTAAGTYSWDADPSNWTTGFPNAVDDVANLNVNLAGAQTINLNQAITLGTLNLGDTGSSYFTTTIAANGGSLILDVTSGSATIAKATAANNVIDTISAGIQLNDNLVVTNAATTANSLTLSGIISESGGAKTLTKNGAGVLRLSGTNTYSGGTVLDTGSLAVNSSGAIGSGTLTINGGTLTLGASLSNNNPIVANGNFNIGGVFNTGSGSFRISTPITVSGGADNSGGIGSNISNVITDASGGNTLNAFDMTYSITGTTTAITLSAGITLRADQTLNATISNSNAGLNISGVIGDSGAARALTIAGSGAVPTSTSSNRNNGVMFSADNTYTGTTTINSGALLSLGKNTTTGSINGSSSVVNNGTLMFWRSNTITQGTGFGTISGTGAVLQFGGTTVLNAANTYAGGTTLLGGTLSINGNSALGTAGARLTLSGGSLQFAASSTVDLARPVVMSGNATVDTSLASGTISGLISSTANLTKTGGNNLTLSGINTFTGDTTISGGKVLLGNALALQNSTYVTTGSTGAIGLDFNGVTTPTLGGLSGAVSLETATTGFGSVTTLNLNPQSGKTPSYSGVIGVGAGALALVKTGAGTQTLSGANTFTGGVTIRGGTLIADTATNATVLQTAGLTFDGTGTFRLTGRASNAMSQAFSGLTLTTGEATIDANNTGTSTTIDLGSITRAGSSTVDFRASNGTFGTTALVNSTQANDANGILGTWATVGGANWAANNGSNVIVAYASYTDVALGGTIADGSSSNVRINSGSSGNITLGATTTTINTLLQNTSTAATVSTTGGTLRFGTGGGVMVGTGKQALTIGTAANSGIVTAGGNADNVAGELVFNNSSSNGLTVNSTITNNGTGAVSVVKSGTGLLTLGGTNTFSGGFTLNSGTVTPTSTGFGTGTLTINGGGITVNSLTLSGGIPIVMNGDWAARTGNSGAVLNTGTGGITLNRPITINVTNSVLTLGGAISSPGSAFNSLDITFTRSDNQGASANFTAGFVLRGNQVANPIAGSSSSGTFPGITYNGVISDGGNGYGMTFSAPTSYTLGAANTFTGPIVIGAGSTVVMNPGASVRPSSITIAPGGTLRMGEQNLGNSAATVITTATIENNGTLRLGDNTAYVQGVQFPSGISGAGVVEIAGTRVNATTLNGTNTYSGGTRVLYGGGGGPVVLNINSANAIGTGPLTLSQSGANSATIDNTSGAAITLATNNAQNWNGPFIFTGTQSLNFGSGPVTLANNPTAQVSANTLTVGGTMSASTQTLSKTGGGTLALNGATTLGSLNIGNQTGTTNGGTLSVGSTGTLSVGTGTSSVLRVGEGGSTSYGRGTLDLSTASSFIANVGTFSVGYSTRGNGDTITGGVLNLGAANTITATSVIIGEATAANGAGGTREVTTAASGTTTINTGGMNIAIGGVNTSSFTLGSNASLTLRGAGGAGTRTGLTIGSSNVAWGSSGGSMNLSGGTASLLLSQLVVGRTTSTGNVGPSSLTIGSSATNHLNISAATGNAVQIGFSSSANTAAGSVTIGNLDAASEIATADPSAAAILLGSASSTGTATGLLSLNGGTLKITTGGGAAIVGGSVDTSLNLDGGARLVAGSAHSDWINGIGLAEVKSGGATIDTNGFAIGMSQPFWGAGGLTKAGLGTLTLNGASTYVGPTTVSAGVLNVASLGSIDTSPLTLNGGTLRYNSATDYAGTFTGTSGTIGGTNLRGGLGGISIGTSLVLSPGNSPGTAATTSQTWAGGGTYLWEINSAANTAGLDPGWDLLSGTDTLTVSATSGSKFTLAITSLTQANAAGSLFDFDDETSYAWKIADFANPVSGFSTGAFQIDTTGFANAFTGTFGVALGTSVTGGDNTEVYVTYSAVPEPATLGLLAAAGLAGAIALRRRRA